MKNGRLEPRLGFCQPHILLLVDSLLIVVLFVVLVVW